MSVSPGLTSLHTRGTLGVQAKGQPSQLIDLFLAVHNEVQPFFVFFNANHGNFYQSWIFFYSRFWPILWGASTGCASPGSSNGDLILIGKTFVETKIGGLGSPWPKNLWKTWENLVVWVFCSSLPLLRNWPVLVRLDKVLPNPPPPGGQGRCIGVSFFFQMSRSYGHFKQPKITGWRFRRFIAIFSWTWLMALFQISRIEQGNLTPSFSFRAAPLVTIWAGQSSQTSVTHVSHSGQGGVGTWSVYIYFFMISIEFGWVSDSHLSHRSCLDPNNFELGVFLSETESFHPYKIIQSGAFAFVKLAFRSIS